MEITTIFFAVLAGIVCFQLYNVLGSKQGHEPEEKKGPFGEEAPEASFEELPEEKPVYEKPLEAWEKDIVEKYPTYETANFLEGAKAAYEMIVEAFSSAKLADVKPFIAPSIFKAFKTAIEQRENSGQVSELQFVGIENASVENSSVTNSEIKLTVKFSSNQVRVLKDKDGNIVDGDPNRIDLVKDVWTFSRSLSSADPNWILVETSTSN